MRNGCEDVSTRRDALHTDLLRPSLKLRRRTLSTKRGCRTKALKAQAKGHPLRTEAKHLQARRQPFSRGRSTSSLTFCLLALRGFAGTAAGLLLIGLTLACGLVDGVHGAVDAPLLALRDMGGKP